MTKSKRQPPDEIRTLAAAVVALLTIIGVALLVYVLATTPQTLDCLNAFMQEYC